MSNAGDIESGASPFSESAYRYDTMALKAMLSDSRSCRNTLTRNILELLDATSLS